MRGLFEANDAPANAERVARRERLDAGMQRVLRPVHVARFPRPLASPDVVHLQGRQETALGIPQRQHRCRLERAGQVLVNVEDDRDGPDRPLARRMDWQVAS